ncbi:MAG: cobalamin-independent methionine synthase II family protein [Stellaceae bacterium]
MTTSTERILTTHAGSLPRPPELRDLVLARTRGEAIDETALERQLPAAVREAVARQAQCGLDIVNDGELSKPNFTDYVATRLSGIARRPGGSGLRRLSMTARDEIKFPDYFTATRRVRHSGGAVLPVCVGELHYVGEAELKRDLDNFRTALNGIEVVGAFLPANTPGTIEHWLDNEHYENDEAFLFAIAEAMRTEYEAIVNAGFLLQIDDPDLPDGWACRPNLTLPQYRDYAALRVAALNHGLRNIPKEKIRLHVCWGSFHGPHHDDIPLKDIIDLIFRVRAGSYSIEASNPCHEHEWRVFETVKLPEGATLVPGVVGHCTDFIEHPDLVAERLVRYARLVGRENVLAGTDCGLGTRVGHPSICWAKFDSLVEGARRASRTLWGRV